MIEVNILSKWREMNLEQARRMAEFYCGEESEEYADAHIHGATVFELLNSKEVEV